MELETVNKLYLELSQFATAKTARELSLERLSQIHSIGVLREVSQERERQDRKWGGPEHDDKHAWADFCGFIDDRLVQCKGIEDHEYHKQRNRMIEIAALAVANVERMDRAMEAAYGDDNEDR